MAEYTCAKHGQIGNDVLSTRKMIDSMRVNLTGEGVYPKQQYICGRCLKQLIDDHFPPLRVKD